MNKAKLSQRILAYLIDLIIIIILISLIEKILPNDNLQTLNKLFNDTTNLYANKQISFSIYFNQAALLYKQLDKARIMNSVINAILIFIYSIFL